MLFTFLSSYAIVCFLSLIREDGKKVILLLGFIVLISLSGNFYGLLSERRSGEQNQWEQQVMEYLDQEKQEVIRLMGAEEIIEFIGIHMPQVQLIYGKDLYTGGMDLGILDAYDPGLLAVYEAMKNPGEQMEIILEAAVYYDCNTLIFSNYDEAPNRLGNYEKKETIGNYVIYMN